jgi:hypothetical protein
VFGSSRAFPPSAITTVLFVLIFKLLLWLGPNPLAPSLSVNGEG